MSNLNSSLTRLKKLSREKSTIEVNSWDAAIRKAKLRIQELKIAITTFEAKKNTGEPWPAESATHN